jgi:hypothetical protein
MTAREASSACQPAMGCWRRRRSWTAGDGGVAGVADGVEDELLALGGFAVDDAGPGDVVPDGLGLLASFGPDVDEDEVAGADGREEAAVGS